MSFTWHWMTTFHFASFLSFLTTCGLSTWQLALSLSHLQMENCAGGGIFLITGMTVFLFISTVYPNGQLLRPDTFARDNIFVHIVQRLHASDTPTNLFPSIHVYNSLAIYFGLAHSQKLQNKKWIKNAALVLTVCIILSTMFLKQHSVFDVLTAFALAAFMYSVCYGSIAVAFERRRQKRIPAGQI